MNERMNERKEISKEKSSANANTNHKDTRNCNELKDPVWMVFSKLAWRLTFKALEELSKVAWIFKATVTRNFVNGVVCGS